MAWFQPSLPRRYASTTRHAEKVFAWLLRLPFWAYTMLAVLTITYTLRSLRFAKPKLTALATPCKHFLVL